MLGFTETALIPGISTAGRTPQQRQFTAIADAEFLYNGPRRSPRYPLPPLDAGVSPALIAKAAIDRCGIPLTLVNAGLPVPPPVPAIDLGGIPAKCLSAGAAFPLEIADSLFRQGLIWGEKLAAGVEYLVIGECVVGGTTTALSVLTGLGFDASGKVNSSHPRCNHGQKWAIVRQGLQRAGYGDRSLDPMQLVAAVGDPMQIAVAGMAIAASRSGGVLLAGGTQMLAVYALTRAIAGYQGLEWKRDRVAVGTTRWVAEDPSGDTCGLAKDIGEVPLLATQLSFANSRYGQLRAYERGYVKEGMGAGGCAIAAHLYKSWGQHKLFEAIEVLVERYDEIEEQRRR